MTACPDGRCDGSGFIYDEERRLARPCSCRPQLQARKRAAAVAGRIPKRYREVSFDREPVLSIERANRDVTRAVRHYVQNISEHIRAGQGIWFAGDVGTGKTTLAMLISKTAMERDHTVAIYSLPRLLGILRETFDDDAQLSLTQFIDRLVAVDLLHIDDVGAEQTSDWVLEQLYTIVNTRYEENKAVLLTTNLVGPHRRPSDDTDHPAPELARQIGDRTVSRIWEICGEPLFLGGIDRRIDRIPEPVGTLTPDPFAEEEEWRYGRPRRAP